MLTQSCKAKARALQNIVRDMIIATLPIEFKQQARSAIMGETGTDIKLVSTARELFPWAVECKNQERLNLWDSWNQTVENTNKENKKEDAYNFGLIETKILKPLLAIKRNRTDVLVVLKAIDFFELIEKVKK